MMDRGRFLSSICDLIADGDLPRAANTKLAWYARRAKSIPIGSIIQIKVSGDIYSLVMADHCLIPSDGRELARVDYPVLSQTYGSRFGGNEEFFKLRNVGPDEWIEVTGVN